MVNEPPSEFSMKGARKAVSQGLQHVEAQVEAIEDAVSSNPGLAFDLAKTLVESACRTILTERGGSWAEKDDLPRLFRQVRSNLPVLTPNETQQSAVRQSIFQTLTGLGTTVQGIAELRNELGFASHGSDSHKPTMGMAHAIFVAQAADTIVGFLYDIHVQERTTVADLDPVLARDSDFDEYVDDQQEAISILGVDFLPSEVLFQIEPDSYRALLVNFLDQAGSEDEEI